MSLLASVLLILIFARILGYGARRLQQPALVGEILGGVVLGPVCLNVLKPTPGLSTLSDLAVFFIVLCAGMEMDFSKVLKAFRGPALFIAILGFLIPLASGMAVGFLYHLEIVQTVFLGLCISITALPVTVWILKNLNLLKHRLADYSIAAAIVNDMAAFMILGVVLDLSAGKDTERAFLTAGFSIIKLVFFMAIVWMGYWGFKQWEAGSWRWKKSHIAGVNFRTEEASLGLAVLGSLAYGVFAEGLGFHAVIGIFFGALILGRRGMKGNQALHLFAEGFWAPLFFGFLGLEFSLEAFHSFSLLTTVILAAVLSKILGGFLGGKLGGLPFREALGAGIIINGRGMVELVVAGIGLQKGLIGPDLFSILVLMGLITTFLTPLLFKQLVYLKPR